MSERRDRWAVLLTGGRIPDPSLLTRGELVLDAGAEGRLPPGLRVVAAGDLLPAAEARALQQGCLELASTWHAGLAQDPGLRLSPGRVVESAVLLELGQALKHLLLLRRLAEREGPIDVVADPSNISVRRIRGVLATDPVPVRILAPVGFRATVGRAARLVRGTLRPRRGAGRSAKGEATSPRGSRLRIWGLANYRNRRLLDLLARDRRFAVRWLERNAENQYLPGPVVPVEDVATLALQGLANARGEIEGVVRTRFPEIPGAPEIALAVLRDAIEEAIPIAEAQGTGWQTVLRTDRPDVIVSGIPWSGDLRVLAMIAARERIPMAVCQDGVLSELGAGGVPIGGAALAWGPMGREWFYRRGFPAERIFLVGDPYLDDLRSSVRGSDPATIRRRHRIPAGSRVLLASLQNSAPHVLWLHPGDPVLAARFFLDAIGRSRGWVLVLKPHPRIPIVDGPRRLRTIRRLASSVPAARVVAPDEPIAPLMAAADAHVGEGDTLSLEMLACGKPAVVLTREGHPAPYPEFVESGAMTPVGSAAELAAFLEQPAGPDPRASSSLLERHLARDVEPEEAVFALAGGPRPGRRP